MDINNYITSFSALSKGSIFKNGTLFFESTEADTPAFFLSAYQYLGVTYPKFYKMDSLSKLGWLAAEVLLKGSQVKAYQPNEVGVILANANSSLDSDLKYHQSLQDVPSPALFVYTLPNIMIGEICIRNNFKGEHAFFIFEKFDADFMHSYVNNLLHNNVLNACICGWVDLLKDEYKAVLYLVEKVQCEGAIKFNAENVSGIFNNELTNNDK